MRARRLLLPTILLLAGLLALASTTLGNAQGAPRGSNANGCTCHGLNPSDLASVSLVDPPPAYTPGTTYDLSLRVMGQATPTVANMGGFAITVDVGTLASVDDRTQVREGMLTHTMAGNDQRVWTFEWRVPANATGDATFVFAGNAVNGNTVNDPADLWNEGTLKVPRGEVVAPPSSATPPPSTGGPEISNLGVVMSLVACVLVLARRRIG